MKKRLLMTIPLLSLLFSSCGGSIPNSGETVTPSQDSEAEKQIKEIYNLYKANGGVLSYEEWLATIKGEKGDPGKDGSSLLSGIGEPSINLGKSGDMYLDTSNYDLYSKSESGWAKIGNFKGEHGEDGKSAYEIAVEHGFTGTEEEWLESLKGGSTYVTGVTFENNIIYVHYSDGHVEEINMASSEDPVDPLDPGDDPFDPESTYAKIDVPEGITPKIKFWHTFGDLVEYQLLLMLQDFKAKVLAKEGVNVDVEIYHYGNYNDTVNVVGKDAAIGVGPTMLVTYPDAVASLMKQIPDSIINMQDYLTDEVYGLGSDGYLGDTVEGESDFISSYLEEGRQFTVSGTYTLPYMKSSEVMLYNLDMLKVVLPAYDSTIEEGQIETYLKNISFDKLMDIADFAKKNAGALGLSSLEYPVYYDSDVDMLISQIEQKGLKFATKDANSNVVLNLDASKDPDNSAAVAELLNQYRTWHNDGLLNTRGAEGFNNYDAFKNGKTIFYIGSSGGAGYSFPDTGTFDFGVCKVPYASETGVGAKYISKGPSIALLNCKASTNEENYYNSIYSWKFYKYITNTKNSVRTCVNHSMGYVPVKESCYKNSDWLDYIADEDNLYAKTAQVLRQEIGDNFITPLVFSGSAAYKNEVGSLVADAMTNNYSIEDLIATAVNNTYKRM